ncbi:DMT family transporter [Salinarimonas soli]|uniref:DMT family transporter n=1 Tax=Salinarimonas soli TaxID=1638099 RepID=A0A5B2VSZ0_9HYPH|nr:DMT family transporter [Salinarimonas soli]KAA2241239.1 DMT family transporter [Salinarimonas soli]
MGPSRTFLAAHLLGAGLFWGSGFLFIKLTDGALAPPVLAACRGAVAALALSVWFVSQGWSMRPKGAEWRHWAVLGTLNGWGPNILTAFAMTQITAGLGSMIQASGPILVAVLSHLAFADERLTRARVGGVLVGFLGMGILIGPRAFDPAGAAFWGVMAMVATAVSYAVGNVYVRFIREAQPARLAFGQQLFSAMPAIAIALTLIGPAGFAPAGGVALPVLALGILGTALPIVLFMRLIRAAGPTRAAMVGYLTPVAATLLAMAFLGEHIGPRELLGGAVVLAGVYLVSTARRA